MAEATILVAFLWFDTSVSDYFITGLFPALPLTLISLLRSSPESARVLAGS